MLGFVQESRCICCCPVLDLLNRKYLVIPIFTCLGCFSYMLLSVWRGICNKWKQLVWALYLYVSALFQRSMSTFNWYIPVLISYIFWTLACWVWALSGAESIEIRRSILCVHSNIEQMCSAFWPGEWRWYCRGWKARFECYMNPA
jgi:hypothetical protein